MAEKATVEVPGVGLVEVDALEGGQIPLEEVPVYVPRAAVEPERVAQTQVDPFSRGRLDPTQPNIDFDPAIFEQVNPAQPNVSPLAAFGVNPAIEQTPGAPEGPTRLPQIARAAGAAGYQVPPADLSVLTGQKERLLDRESRMEKEFDQRRAINDMELEAEQTRYDISIQRDEDYIQQLRKSYEAAKQPLPEWDPQPLIDPKEFQSFAFALLALGLIGGIRGGDAWMQAGAAMAGGVHGYIEGNKKKMEYNWQNFQQHYRRAIDIQNENRKEYEDALRDKNLSINQKIRRVGLIATRLGHENMRLESEFNHSINGIERQITSLDEQMARINTQYEGFNVRMQLARDRLNQSNASASLTTDARQVRNNINETLGPGNKYTRLMDSRYSGAQARIEMNDLVEQMKEENPTFSNRQIADRMIQNASWSKAVDQALDINFKREEAVLHLTIAVHDIEADIKRLARSVVPTDMPIANLTINELQTKLGGPNAGPILQLKQEMNEASRQFMRAVTMPNSNAQLHAGTADLAGEVFNENMNMEQILGSIAGMETAIMVTHGAYSKVVVRLMDDLASRWQGGADNPLFTPETIRRLEESKSEPAGVSWKDPQTEPPK